MTVANVLREVEARGLAITVVGSELRLQGSRERMDPALVGHIREHKADLIAHLGACHGFPLTDLQRAYLVGRGDLYEIGSVASHVYHEIEGAWDVGRLEAALRTVVARHGMLRTRFTPEGRQIEESSAEVRIERLDLRGRDGAAQRERLAELREQWSHRILPVDRAPLLAVQVVILAQDRMVLQVSHDGLVMDAISMFLFFRQWWSAYTGAADQAPAGEEASFGAYVAAVEAARDRAPGRRSRAHWLERVKDLAPLPDLPLRTSPATITRPRFTTRFARLDAPSWAALKARAAAAGLTPSGVLLAAYAETLACWGAGSRFTLNTTVANRPPIHPRIGEAIGNFGETMLAELALDRQVSFLERVRAIQAQLRRELDNRHVSGIEVLRELARHRGGTAGARMPYTFNSVLGYPGIDASALELFGPETYTASQTPQVWVDVTAFEQHGGVVVEFDTVDALFPDGLIADLVGGYQRLLTALLDEESWSRATFDLLPAEQRERRKAANDTAAVIPDGLVPAAFVAQARRTPDAPAIIHGTVTLTYGELHRRAAEAATWLRQRGLGRDELVGLVMHRGPEQIVGILATVLAGAAYLPVDAALPAARQGYLLADGRVRVVLTNARWRDPDGRDREALDVDVTRPVPPGQAPPDLPPLPGAGGDDLAYVLYTSGTTGEPKGVMVSRRSVANVVADCNARFGIGPHDRFFGISAFNFDLSVYDVFGALSAGAALVMPDRDRAADPAHWLDLCARAGVTVWNSVPAIVSLLHGQAAADGPGALASLRLVMMSGDRIPPALPAALRTLNPDLGVVSLGGPTETTIWNILHPVGPGEDGTTSIPYGRPNANNRVYVLDEHGAEMPDWVTGEICAAGAGLARGYWGDEARTAERFTAGPRRGERLYRTGDLGRWLPTGEIEILGRSDFQIKVNGYRIEAGEAETRLVALDGVRHAVVARQEGMHGDRLVAHLVPDSGPRRADTDVRDALREHLPEYMVPSTLYWHDSLPLTRNGKVDRARLAVMAGPGPAQGQAGPAPDSELERKVAELWSSVLGLPGVDATSNFYDLGGDSLGAARVLAGVRKRFGVGLTLDQLSQVETVRAMAARIAAAQADKEGRR
jgi:amino acid adenylation domain-containing protein